MFPRLFPDNVIVDELRRDAIKAHYLAKSTWDAYKQAAVRLYECQLEKMIGVAQRQWPTECIMAFSDGAKRVKIVRVEIDYAGTIEIVIHGKTKAGRWRKSKYWYDATKYLKVFEPIDSEQTNET